LTNKQLGRAFAVLACIAGFAASCSRESALAPESGYRIEIASGDQQLGRARAALAAPLVAKVAESASGAPVVGVRVRFSIEDGSEAAAQLLDSVAVTDGDGYARAWLTLGEERHPGEDYHEDEILVRATISAAPWRSVRFSQRLVGEITLTSVTPTSVKGGDTLRYDGTNLNGVDVVAEFGTTRAPARGVVIVPPCLAPGVTAFRLLVDGKPSNAISINVVANRAPLALAPLERITLPATRLSDCVSLAGNGAQYLVAAQFAGVGSPNSVEWLFGADTTPALLTSAREPATARPRASQLAQREFDSSIRTLEEAIAGQVRAQLMTQVKTEVKSEVRTQVTPQASLRIAPPPPAPGSTRGFRVVSRMDGTAFTTVTARLRYAGEHVLVYTDLDSGSDTTAFSDEQLSALSMLYDRDLYGAAVNAFGADPDLDGNGRIIVLFSPVINRMSRAEDCLLRGYVTGFVYPVDQLERDPNSNRGEIFYGFVPDPLGKFSCPHTEAEVIRVLQPTFLHEMQHLISFNERVLARGAPAEELWLNEGLSQMAEELGSRLFEARYPAPAGRSSTQQLFPDSAAPFIAPQMLNAYVYLFFALDNSLTSYEAHGSFEERGGTWLFLRWLADQKGDGILRRLVQGSRRGVENVETVTGEKFGALFGDFGLALLADSLPGRPRLTAPERLRFKSRNLRQLMAREAVVSGFMDPWPLRAYVMSNVTALRAAMPVGTMMHALLQSSPGSGPIRLSFTSPGGAPFAPPFGAQVSIMRLP
jgi:hypothetical protein